MSQKIPITLEERLARVTVWTDPAPELWRNALETPAPQSFLVQRVVLRALATIRSPSGVAAALLVLAVGVVITVSMSVSQERSVGMARPEAPAASAASSPEPAMQLERRKVSDNSGEPRVVVRNASVNIQTDDVRSLFIRIPHFLNQTAGEFVQQSSLSGGDQKGEWRRPMYASLTLRVVSARLDEVMALLREAGTVTTETSTGEDVTAQSIDLAARLRNEQAAETELLKLLASRPEAPLADILAVREQIAKVRENIETIIARRDRLSTLAELASITVIIQEGDDARTASTRGSFALRLGNAWDSGLRSLGESFAWLVRVLIGGAFWWSVLLVLGFFIARSVRRARRYRP